MLGLKDKFNKHKKYNIGSSELLKNDNKAEFDTAKLQTQQSKYLGQVWKKSKMDYSNSL
jgi:hypothetical protein